MGSQLATFEEANQILSRGGNYLIAADERVLRKLPKGNWIGGTIPYFISNEGGIISQDKVFMTDLPEQIRVEEIQFFKEKDIDQVYSKIPSNGFGVIILPASTPLHLSFAINAPNYQNFAVRPLVGWVSGVHLNELGQSKPLTVNGRTGEVSDTNAIVMFLDLPEDRVCDVGIVNIFEQGHGHSLKFPDTGFQVKDVLVDGQKKNFADFLLENKIDIKNPLVANYAGAMINVSFQAIDEKSRTVSLYAPVFTGIEYRLANPVTNYVKSFVESLPQDANEIVFSCNCILNFLYSELEGKKTGSITGPITFGEVAYQLLNQTMVYLKVLKI